MSTINFYGSQLGGEDLDSDEHLDYRSPWTLFIADILSFFKQLPYIIYVAVPLKPIPPGLYDELNLKDPRNVADILIHLFLFIYQLGIIFLLIPFCILFPIPAWLSFILFGTSMFINWAICTLLLNGFKLEYESQADLTISNPKFDHEQWIFLNGVAVGHHWLQNNINRLALTFGRPVLGIHNKTSGVIFDVLQCLIQRNLDYATADVRTCYTLVKRKLYDPSLTRIIFIMHSQGAIEGGMIIDWLLQEMPQDLLLKLEIYTFGNAANHFNNPYLSRSAQSSSFAANAQNKITSSNGKVIRYIEHYANETDFVARWGVLNFTKPKSRAEKVLGREMEVQKTAFMGRVFERPGVGGHQLDQHYLDLMFPLHFPLPTPDDPHPRPYCKENNAFMEMKISTVSPDRGDDGVNAMLAMEKKKEKEREGMNGNKHANGNGNSNGHEYGITKRSTRKLMLQTEKLWKGVARETLGQSFFDTAPAGRERVKVLDAESPVTPLTVTYDGRDGGGPEELKVKHFSRLWLYRNGKSPPDLHNGIAVKRTETV